MKMNDLFAIFLHVTTAAAVKIRADAGLMSEYINGKLIDECQHCAESTYSKLAVI